MGVVADRAVARANRTMDVRHLQPGFFVNMALKAGVFHLACRNGDFVGINGGLMTGPALKGRRRAMLPVVIYYVFMAAVAQWLGLTFYGQAWGGRLIFMALFTNFRQKFVAVEKKYALFFEVDI